MYHSMDANSVLRALKTNRNGLSEEEAKRRLKEYGPNVLEEKKESKFEIFLRQFKSPLIYILLVAALISLISGKTFDAILIVSIVLINSLIGFYQELKAIASIEALKKITETKVRVLREGREKIVPSSEIVPGDIVIIEEGDIVPADLRLIESIGLLIDESMITGESVPVEKNADVVLDKDTPLYKRVNIAFKGTIVVRGRGVGAVYATGKNTEMGKIAEKVQEKSPESPLTRAIANFSRKWVMFLIFLSTLAIIVGFIQGRDLLEVGSLIIAELVSAVPEGLPIAITLVLIVGAMRLSRRKTLVKYLPAVETLGNATYIASDKTGTITEGKLHVADIYTKNREILYKIAALCNDANITEDGVEDGDPLEIALLKWLEKSGVDWRSLRRKHEKVWEFPFDTKRRLMAASYKIDGKVYTLVKGAFESLREMATNDESELKMLERVHEEMAERGLRVLSLGYMVSEDAPKDIDSIRLEIIGFIGFIDPPKRGVAEAVKIAKQAGIKIIMITGDSLTTAEAIAREVGILEEGDIAITGKDMEKLSDKELYKLLKKVRVVARALPEDKYRIVKVLQEYGEVVAVTGDGINDIPALKVADLGIAMGSGSEAAKEASKMIITDNNLAVIVEAIKYGRIIVNNIRKLIYYLLSTTFAEITLLTIAFLLDLPIPLYAVQILWINLVTDGVLDKTFPFIHEDKDVMKEKPKRPEKVFLDAIQLTRILMTGLIIGIINLAIFVYATEIFSLETAIAITFTSMVVSQWIVGWQAMRDEPFLKDIKKNFTINPYFFIGLSIGIVLQLLVTYVFPEFLHTRPLGLYEWYLVLIVIINTFIYLEATKWLYYIAKQSENQ